jgi:uncharacterized protein (DUF433 family)
MIDQSDKPRNKPGEGGADVAANRALGSDCAGGSRQIAGAVYQGSARIVADEGMCGGAARVRGTRIPVWVLEDMRRLGYSDADILSGYPELSADDLVAAWNYVTDHREQIEILLAANDR